MAQFSAAEPVKMPIGTKKPAIKKPASRQIASTNARFGVIEASSFLANFECRQRRQCNARRSTAVRATTYRTTYGEYSPTLSKTQPDILRICAAGVKSCGGGASAHRGKTPKHLRARREQFRM